MPLAVLSAQDVCTAALLSGSPQNLLVEASHAGRLRLVTGDRLLTDYEQQMTAYLDSVDVGPDDPLRDLAQKFIDLVAATSVWVRDRPHDATITYTEYLAMLALRSHANWLVVADPSAHALSYGVSILTAQDLLRVLP